MEHFMTRKNASERLGVHYNTLYNMHRRNEIETVKIGGRTLYNVNKYLISKGILLNNNTTRKNICYCRVSSRKQKEDLIRQINYMKKEYPYHEIITDIASGLNFKRSGLQKIIRYAIANEINEIVIAYKDRLARFGFDLIQWIIKQYSDGKITIKNSSEEKGCECIYKSKHFIIVLNKIIINYNLNNLNIIIYK